MSLLAGWGEPDLWTKQGLQGLPSRRKMLTAGAATVATGTAAAVPRSGRFAGKVVLITGATSRRCAATAARLSPKVRERRCGVSCAVTSSESHTERSGAKLEHGKELNVTERRLTVDHQ